MKRILAGVFAIGLVSTGVYGGQEQATLTELQKARIELHLARVELAQTKAKASELEARAASCELNNERAAFEKELLEMGYRIDWPMRTLIPVASEAPKQP